MTDPMPIAGRRLATPAVALPPQRRRQLLLQHRLDQPADPLPHPSLDRVEPDRPVKHAGFRRSCVILLHGVISLGASTPSLVVELTRRLRPPNFHTLRYTTVPRPRKFTGTAFRIRANKRIVLPDSR